MAPTIFRRGKTYRIDRRRFVADLGRGTFALAILGPAAVACSSDATTSEASTGEAATAAPSPTDPPAATTPANPPSATEAPAATQDADSEQATGPLEWAQVSLGFVSAYVLVRGNTAAVIDSGLQGSVDQIGAGLATLGANLDDVQHVLLTHSHGDHVGGLVGVLDAAPGATVYAGTADIPNIISPNPITAVGDGDDVFGLQILDTPGHTPGSISMLDPEIGLLIAGDALNTNSTGTEITAANPNFTPDMATADVSVKKLAALDFDALAVGHGNPVLSGASPLLAEVAASLG